MTHPQCVLLSPSSSLSHFKQMLHHTVSTGRSRGKAPWGGEERMDGGGQGARADGDAMPVRDPFVLLAKDKDLIPREPVSSECL